MAGGGHGNRFKRRLRTQGTVRSVAPPLSEELVGCNVSVTLSSDRDHIFAKGLIVPRIHSYFLVSLNIVPAFSSWSGSEDA